jgi:hypothetical protein
MIATISKFCTIRVRIILNALTPGASLGFVVGTVLYFSNRKFIEFQLAPLSCLVMAILLANVVILAWLIFVGQRGLPDDLKLAISRLIANRPILQRWWSRCAA